MAGHFAVNIRAIRDPYVNPFKIQFVPSFLFKESTKILNIDRLAIKTVDVEDKRVFEPLTGTLSGGQTKPIFACHCGKVQAQLMTPIEDQEVKEDNCSLCVRVSST